MESKSLWLLTFKVATSVDLFPQVPVHPDNMDTLPMEMQLENLFQGAFEDGSRRQAAKESIG